MKMRGLPGMLAPRYQELQLGAVYMVPSATSFTCAGDSAVGVVAALAVRDRDGERPPGRDAARER